LGPEHPDTLSSVNNLAICLNGSDRRADALDLLRERAGKSSVGLCKVRYNLACYECLSGNHAEARGLIADEIAAHPEKKADAINDSDLAAIHDFIRGLPEAPAAS
jgi:Flp pilus assembly protein TadD